MDYAVEEIKSGVVACEGIEENEGSQGHPRVFLHSLNNQAFCHYCGSTFKWQEDGQVVKTNNTQKGA